jgi:tetratricopeptide (TPR) repeat protein
MMSRKRTPRSPTPAPVAAARVLIGRPVAEGCLLFCLVLLVYVPSLSSSFIWDDDDYVTENSTLRSLDGLRRIWLEPEATPQYYPVVFTAFWIEHHLWGLRPAGYHAVNAVLHAANAVGIWLILRRLAVPGAWFAAALFGLHPVHVESVAWVTELKNVLSASFYLLAVWQFLIWVEKPPAEVDRPAPPHGLRWYALGFCFFVGALLSKSVTCSLPAVLLLLRWWRVGRIRMREVGALVPLFVVGALLAFNTAWLERAQVGASGSAFSWTIAERILIAGRALWSYAITLVWPVDLCFIYPRWTIEPTAWWAWAIALGAIAVPLVLALWHRRVSGPLLALLYFGGTLLPALGFFNVFPMRYAFVADHYQYLASLGLLALVAAWWFRPQTPGEWNWRLPSPANIAIDVRRAIAAVALLGLACLAWQRQSAFQDSGALWSQTLARNPTSMIANIQMGRLASRRKDFTAAERYFRDGLRYRTDDLETHEFETNLAHTLSAQGRFAEAAAEFRSALARKPDYPEALNGLANVAASQHNYQTAVDLYGRSLAVQPGNAIVRTNLANALAASGKSASAEREYRTAVESDPSSSSARLGLALLLARVGKLQQAESECLEILQLEPNHAAATRLLARIRLDVRIAQPRGANDTRG